LLGRYFGQKQGFYSLSCPKYYIILYYTIQYTKNANDPSTIYLYTSYYDIYGIEQNNGLPIFAIKSYKSSKEGMELSFYWDIFNIEKLVEKKIISSSFDGAALGISEPAPSQQDS